MELIFAARTVYWTRPQLGQLTTPLACYRKGGCTPEGIPVNPPPEWWGASTTKTAQQNDQIQKNSVTIWTTLSEYPYPSPFLPGEGVSFFLGHLKSDLVDLASANYDLQEEDVKTWITIEMLSHYNDWVAEIQAAQKRLNERRKHAAIERAIVATVGSLVMVFAAPAAFVALFAAIRTGLQTYQDLKNSKEAIAAMKEAYTAFADSDPAFAEEVKKVQALMEKWQAEDDAKAAAAAAGKTAPDTAIKFEAPAESPTKNLLLVGGALAVVGLGALLLFKS